MRTDGWLLVSLYTQIGVGTGVGYARTQTFAWLNITRGVHAVNLDGVAGFQIAMCAITNRVLCWRQFGCAQLLADTTLIAAQVTVTIALTGIDREGFCLVLGILMKVYVAQVQLVKSRGYGEDAPVAASDTVNISRSLWAITHTSRATCFVVRSLVFRVSVSGVP